MIIFGTTSLDSTKESGAFHCPRCAMQRGYRWINVNRFFTLYFIPLIPLGSAGEYIKCDSCGGTYGTEVLSYNPEEDRAEMIATIRRLLVLLLVQARKTGPDKVEALRNVFHEYLDEDVPASVIQQEMQQAQQAGVSLNNFARQSADDFSEDGISLVMVAAKEVIASGGFLSDFDKDVLRELGRGLGVLAPAIEDFLNRQE
jgi:hypothetical protein